MTAQNVQVSGVNPGFDGSSTGNAAGVLYTPAVNLVLRQLNPAFARRTNTLTPSGGTAPPPWTNTYTYPADCLRLRQIRPTTYTANDPQPVRGQVAFDAGLNLKVIVCSIAGAIGIYTSSTPNENQWDWAFAQAVAWRLASPLAMAIAGRPDFSKELMEEANQYAQMAELIDEM